MARPKYLLHPTSQTDDKGNQLFQLWADRDFRTAQRGMVRRGERGGLVGPNSLSHEGGCWVDTHGVVSADSRVEGDAYVSGFISANSLVKGRAHVSGGAMLEDTIVDGDTEITGRFAIVVRSIIEGEARVWNVNVVDCWLTGTATVVGPNVGPRTVHSLKIESAWPRENIAGMGARDDREAACRRAMGACRRQSLDPAELSGFRVARLHGPGPSGVWRWDPGGKPQPTP